MIRALLDTLDSPAFHDFLADLAQLAGAVIIIVSIAVIAIGFAP